MFSGDFFQLRRVSFGVNVRFFVRLAAQLGGDGSSNKATNEATDDKFFLLPWKTMERSTHF